MIQFKKRFFVLSLLFLAVFIIVACEPDRGEDITAPDLKEGEMPEKPKELIVWVNDNDNAQEAIAKRFEDFTEKTGIEIVLEVVPEPDQVQKLSLAGPAGDGPDL